VQTDPHRLLFTAPSHFSGGRHDSAPHHFAFGFRVRVKGLVLRVRVMVMVRVRVRVRVKG
jgi:hypothetical protein